MEFASTPRLPGGRRPTGDDVKAAQVARSAIRGSGALLARQLVTFGVTFLGGVLLARILTPADFGGYALILFIAGLARLLVDGGLAATLVQQRDEPSRDEWSTVLTTQTAIAVALFLALQLCVPLLAGLLPGVEGLDLALRISVFAVLIAPLSSVSIALIERRLQFGRVGLILMIQPVLFNLVAVILAWSGAGLTGLGIALAVSTAAVAPFALWASRTVPRYGFKRDSMTGRLKFGIPFIGANIVSTLKDSVNPLFIGAMFGATFAGYITWAQQLAVVGTYLLAIVARLLFPTFARLQDSPDALRRAVGASVFWANAVVAPITLFVVINAIQITTDVYDPKWLGAVTTLLFLSASNVISPTMSVLLALMNALGRAVVPLIFSLVWFAGTWIFVPLLAAPLGFEAYGVANVIVSAFGLPLLYVARKNLSMKTVLDSLVPWALGTVAIFVGYLCATALADLPGLAALVVSGVIGVSLYVGLLLVVARGKIKAIRSTLAHAKD